MNDFWKSDTYKIVCAIKATGNYPGIVEQWRRQAEAWAACREGPDADALKAWLPLWRVRPFYTADELAPMMPALVVLLGLSTRMSPVKSANRLANELKFAKLPFRVIDNKTYFLVERIHFWKKADAADFMEFLR